MKTVVVSKIHASHTKAVEFNGRLVRLGAEREIIVRDLSKEAKAKLEAAGKVYKYTVVDASKEPYLPGSLAGLELIRIVRHWLNKTQHDVIGALYGYFIAEQATCSSVIYYRVNGILVSGGAGTKLLRDLVVVDDQDWRGIRSGKVEPWLETSSYVARYS